MRICPQCRERTTDTLCPADGFRTVDVEAFEEQNRDPLVGTVFEERYRVEKIIGKGGFGAVYRATQVAVDRPVAIKVLDPRLCKDLKEIARFQQEARAVAGLQHPNIIELYDFGHTAEGSLYLVMEFLDGEPLNKRLEREAPLSPDQVVRLGLQAFDALAEAHESDVIHRDLKPENLFMARRGRRREALKILDFGIAKVAGDASAGMTLTKTGMAIGSPRFMSPEQCTASAVLPQSDLYSLGLILYQALCGQHPFQKQSPTEYLMAHVQEVPPPPAIDDLEVKGPLVDLIMRCLAKQPGDRPASAEEALAALEACSHAPLVEALDATGSLEPVDATAQVPSEGGAHEDPPLQTGRTDVSSGLRSVAPTGPPRWAVTLALMTFVVGVGLAGWFVFGPSGDPAKPAVASSEAAERPSAGKSEPEAEGAGGDEEPGAAARGTAPIEEGLPDDSAESSPGGPTAEADLLAESDGAEEADPPTLDDPPEAEDEAAVPDAPPSEPEEITVAVESDPEGALVLRDGERLGKTPLEVTWMADEDPPEITLVRYGHHRETLALSSEDADRVRVVELSRRPAPKPEPREEPPPAPAKTQAEPAPPPAKPAPEKEPEPSPLDFEMID